jgi:hypothetical protein
LPDGRPDAGKQFPRTKWLGEIVVGAMIKGFDYFILGISDGKDDDRFKIPFSEPHPETGLVIICQMANPEIFPCRYFASNLKTIRHGNNNLLFLSYRQFLEPYPSHSG